MANELLCYLQNTDRTPYRLSHLVSLKQLLCCSVLLETYCLMQSLEELIDKAVPRDIRLNKQLHLDAALGWLFSFI